MTGAEAFDLAARLMHAAATLDIDHPPIIPRNEVDDATGPRADDGTEGPRAPAVGLDLTPELAVLRALAVADATPGGAIMAQALERLGLVPARTWTEDDGA